MLEGESWRSPVRLSAPERIRASFSAWGARNEALIKVNANGGAGAGADEVLGLVANDAATLHGAIEVMHAAFRQSRVVLCEVHDVVGGKRKGLPQVQGGRPVVGQRHALGKARGAAARKEV